jgi:hypothetical protein
MKNILRKILTALSPVIDILFYIPTLLASVWLRFIRQLGIGRFPLARSIFYNVGVYPIRDHYYEPLYNPKRLRQPLEAERALSGINWDLPYQNKILNEFNFSSEITQLKNRSWDGVKYSFDNDTFRAGDSEYLYNVIRKFKPKRIIEIGSGNSTLMAIEALSKNKEENPNYSCEHICIEPFERPWLEKLNIKLVRQLVENVDKNLFKSLGPNDILFIDSSHIIRPQGDVLCEYLEILPLLNPGVIIHVHDIFSPRDYPSSWIMNDMKLWNEQYLLEAFLSHNKDFKIMGALNYLKYHSPQALGQACPVFGSNISTYEPGSFWVQKIT